MERSGRGSEALAAAEAAAKINPGHSLFFTKAAIRRFREAFGPRPAPRVTEQGLRRIQMTSLGLNGRFGNQLLQYAFVRLYAKEHGLAAEFPDWIGRDLFDFDDPFPSAKLSMLDEKQADFFGSLNRRTGIVFSETDISGYFCGHTSAWGGRAGDFCNLFVPGQKLRPLLDRALAQLKRARKTIVAIHLRRGDFGYGRFWIAPPAWYLPWLRTLWPTLDRPILFVATDEPKLVADFAEFSPWDARRLAIDIPGAGFLIDHHVLRHADHLAIANSSFSFSAAMLNGDARSFMRPDPNRRALTAFDPWGADVLLDPVVEPAQVPAAENSSLRQLFRADDSVIHLGAYCAAWTNLARSIHPMLKIVEADADAGLDSFSVEAGIRHLKHLKVEEGGSLRRVLAGASEMLAHGRIDMLHFPVTAGDETGPATQNLRANGYLLFRLGNSGPEQIELGAAVPPGSYIAVQERLLPLLTGAKSEGFDIPAVCSRFGIQVRGVLHVGAHEGKEIASYDAMHADPVVFIEANPAVYARLTEAMRGRSNVICVNRAISDKAGRVKLHLASFDMSSSLLPLAGHLDVYPQIVPVGVIDVDATTLDALLTELGLACERFNLLVIDVQGAEAMVLAGAGQVLRHIEAIQIEVNFAELYRGAAEIDVIDEMLAQAGFKRVATVSAFHPSWGDAFYIRNDTVRARAVGPS
jgi:FkbM family methyltransferase